MRKDGEARPGRTICDFCSRKSVLIDERGVSRCGFHLDDDRDHVKMASQAPRLAADRR